jgi:hypothetical protein
MAYVWFKISDNPPLRVTREAWAKRDSNEMGTLGYPDFQLHTGARLVE